MRLNKYIAKAGVASRRKADQLTVNGNVKVNGIAMRELGYDVKEADVVEVNGVVIKPAEELQYLMLNKPMGYITSMKDEQGRLTVAELVSNVEARIFPVGRLDFNTTGLLIMTNDGDLAYRLTHPKHHFPKTYRVKSHGVLSGRRISYLEQGVDIGGYVTAPAKVKLIKQSESYSIAEIEICEGKNRQVRKMFSAVGNKVEELKRISMGDLRLGRMAEGQYRKLTKEEVEYLKKR